MYVYERDGEQRRRILSGIQAVRLDSMQLPVRAVPLGTSTGGLPLGIRVVANHGQDHRSIGVALALENANVAGWAPPCTK